MPWLGVSTSDHLEHHKRLTSFYAAPTISIDKILMLFVGKPRGWNADFDDETQVSVRLVARRGGSGTAKEGRGGSGAPMVCRRAARWWHAWGHACLHCAVDSLHDG